MKLEIKVSFEVNADELGDEFAGMTVEQIHQEFETLLTTDMPVGLSNLKCSVEEAK